MYGLRYDPLPGHENLPILYYDKTGHMSQKVEEIKCFETPEQASMCGYPLSTRYRPPVLVQVKTVQTTDVKVCKPVCSFLDVPSGEVEFIVRYNPATKGRSICFLGDSGPCLEAKDALIFTYFYYALYAAKENCDIGYEYMVPRVWIVKIEHTVKVESAWTI